jgi:hypothetical protein
MESTRGIIGKVAGKLVVSPGLSPGRFSGLSELNFIGLQRMSLHLLGSKSCSELVTTVRFRLKSSLCHL